jgi:hypothetical protein
MIKISCLDLSLSNNFSHFLYRPFSIPQFPPFLLALVVLKLYPEINNHPPGAALSFSQRRLARDEITLRNR